MEIQVHAYQVADNIVNHELVCKDVCGMPIVRLKKRMERGDEKFQKVYNIQTNKRYKRATMERIKTLRLTSNVN